MKSASRESFRALLALHREISDEWIGPERGVESAERDALAHESLAAALWGALEFYLTEDFDQPHFIPIVTPYRKWNDNPDARYYFAPIRGDAVHRIRGRRGSEVYLSFTVHRGDRDGDWPKGVAADLKLTDMEFGADGCYEIVLSRERVEVDEERRFRIVVAHRDPGLKNWLDAAGRPRGTIYWRHMLPEQAPEVATCRVVRFDEVATGGPNAKREESR